MDEAAIRHNMGPDEIDDDLLNHLLVAISTAHSLA